MSRIRNPITEVKIRYVEPSNIEEHKMRMKTFSSVVANHIQSEKSKGRW